MRRSLVVLASLNWWRRLAISRCAASSAAFGTIVGSSASESEHVRTLLVRISWHRFVLAFLLQSFFCFSVLLEGVLAALIIDSSKISGTASRFRLEIISNSSVLEPIRKTKRKIWSIVVRQQLPQNGREHVVPT